MITPPLSSSVYLLVSKEHPMFKIGKADNIISRLTQLKRKWGEFNLEQSIEIVCSPDASFRLEKNLHYVFSEKNLVLDDQKEGYTEWFDMHCFDDVIEMVNSIAKQKPKEIKEIKQGIILPEREVLQKDRSQTSTSARKQKIALNREQKIAKIKKENIDKANRVVSFFEKYLNCIVYFDRKIGLAVFDLSKFRTPNGKFDKAITEEFKELNTWLAYYNGGASLFGTLYCNCSEGIFEIGILDRKEVNDEFGMRIIDDQCTKQAYSIIENLYNKIEQMGSGSIAHGEEQASQYELFQMRNTTRKIIENFSQEELDKRNITII